MTYRENYRLFFTTIASSALLVAACASLGNSAPVASTEIGPASGSEVRGNASFARVPEGLKLTVSVAGLTPGEHGFHVHEVGDCSAADASSAKGHYNPGNKAHGGHDGEHHAGDLSNLVAGNDGKAEGSFVLTGLSIGSGEMNIDGRALVIHASPDDYKTQPAGNSGKRVGCGVIKRI